MKQILSLLALLTCCQVAGAANWLTEWGTPVTPAAGDVIAIQDVSDTSENAWGKARSTLVGSIWSSASGLGSSQMADADWGDFSLSSGTATIDADVITAAKLADGDWGDISISSNVATIDIGVLRYDTTQSLTGPQIIDALFNLGIDATITGTIISNGSGSEVRKDTTTTTDPTVGDDSLDGYIVGSRWYNTTSDEEFVALSISAGAAVWLSTTNQFALSADLIDDTHIDWGTAGNEVSGADVPLADSGAYFATDNVESALQETAADARKIMIPFTVDSIADVTEYGMFHTDEAITIQKVIAVHEGTGLSTPSVVLDIRHSTDRSAAGNQLETSSFTITSSTTGDSFNSGFEDATVPANSWIWVESSSASGTTDNLLIQIYATYD